VFFGVYQQLQQKDSGGSGAMGTSALGSEPALIEWPAAFTQNWVAYPQNPTIQWEVSIAGHVAESKTLSYNDLAAMPQSYQVRRLASKNGWAFKAEWHGVLLKNIMPHVSVQTGARFVEVEDVHGNIAHFNLAAINKSQAMLVLHQGNHALSPWHGGPVRFMAFEYNAEQCLGQVKAIRFLTKISKDEKTVMDDQAVKAGKYYCYDLRDFQESDKDAELKSF